MPTKGSSGKGGEGKKEHKNKLTSKKSKHYTITGSTLKRSKHCPRCGPGIFLAAHAGRGTCGKCHYTEFEGKPKAQGEASSPGSSAHGPGEGAVGEEEVKEGSKK
jgi:small subunit ribosomal protein S27Ae